MLKKLMIIVSLLVCCGVFWVYQELPSASSCSCEDCDGCTGVDGDACHCWTCNENACSRDPGCFCPNCKPTPK